MMETGGADPAMNAVTLVGGSRTFLAALMSEAKTTGAPARWVTPCFAINSKVLAGSTLRKHTLVPAIAAMVHGKHHPLQWNIGNVQRYVGWMPMPLASTLLMAFR